MPKTARTVEEKIKNKQARLIRIGSFFDQLETERNPDEEVNRICGCLLLLHCDRLDFNLDYLYSLSDKSQQAIIDTERSKIYALKKRILKYLPNEKEQPNDGSTTVVVGAGPTGYSMALDLHNRGKKTVLIVNDDARIPNRQGYSNPTLVQYFINLNKKINENTWKNKIYSFLLLDNEIVSLKYLLTLKTISMLASAVYMSRGGKVCYGNFSYENVKKSKWVC